MKKMNGRVEDVFPFKRISEYIISITDYKQTHRRPKYSPVENVLSDVLILADVNNVGLYSGRKRTPAPQRFWFVLPRYEKHPATHPSDILH